MVLPHGWQQLADSLVRVLAALPPNGVLEVVESIRPDEGRWALAERDSNLLSAMASGQAPAAGEQLLIHADRLAAGGWSAPNGDHPTHWWAEGQPETLANRLVSALHQGFGMAGIEDLAYRAWQNGTLERLVYPELPLPRIDVQYFAMLGNTDTERDPHGLLRRLWIGDRVVDQEFGRDLRWSPSRTLADFDRGRVHHRVVLITRVDASGVRRRWEERARPAPPPVAPPVVLSPPPDVPALREAAPGDQANRLAESERGQVARYLKESPIVAYGWGFDEDPYHPDRPTVVPIHVHTDGEWTWPASLAYYAEFYGFAPEPELLTHIRRREYRPPELSRETLARLGKRLREGPQPPPLLKVVDEAEAERLFTIMRDSTFGWTVTEVPDLMRTLGWVINQDVDGKGVVALTPWGLPNGTATLLYADGKVLSVTARATAPADEEPASRLALVDAFAWLSAIATRVFGRATDMTPSDVPRIRWRLSTATVSTHNTGHRVLIEWNHNDYEDFNDSLGSN